MFSSVSEAWISLMDFLKDPSGTERDVREIARNSKIKRIYLETLMQGTPTLHGEGARADSRDVLLTERELLTDLGRILASEERVLGPDIEILHWLTDWGYTQIGSPLYRDLGGASSRAILKDPQGHPIPFGDEVGTVLLDPLHSRVLSQLTDTTRRLAQTGRPIALDYHFAMPGQLSDPNSLASAIFRRHQDEWRRESLDADRPLNPEKWLGDRLTQKIQGIWDDLNTKGVKLTLSIPKFREVERTVRNYLAKRPPITPNEEMNPLEQNYRSLLERFRFLEWCIATQGQSNSPTVPLFSFLPSFGSRSGDGGNVPETLSDMTREMETVQGQLGSLQTILKDENERREALNNWLGNPETQEMLTLQSQLEEIQEMLLTQGSFDSLSSIFLDVSEDTDIERFGAAFEGGDVLEQLVVSGLSQIEFG